MSSTYDLEFVRALRSAAGAPWFSDPWDLNLVVLRSQHVGRWDDRILVGCLDDAGDPVVEDFACTADAWEGEWTAPTNPAGCVYILDGYYPGGLSVGTHKGRPALRQRTPFRYVRWDPTAGTIPTVAQLEERALKHGFTGICGTHLHNRVSNMAPGRPRTDDSEGCVVSRYYHQHAALLELVATQRSRVGSDVVSPTFSTLE